MLRSKAIISEPSVIAELIIEQNDNLPLNEKAISESIYDWLIESCPELKGHITSPFLCCDGLHIVDLNNTRYYIRKEGNIVTVLKRDSKFIAFPYSDSKKKSL